MKKSILGGLLLISAMTLSFMSCSTGDDGSDKIGSDIVAVVNVGDSCYFVGGSNGYKYIPSTKYTNTNNIKVAYIAFKVLKDESTSQAKQLSVELLYNPLELDATVNSAPTVATLDSVKNDSILGDGLVYYINNRYLTLAINYTIATKTHYFTLCYGADKGFIKSNSASAPDTVRFILRHNANKDAASSTTSQELYRYKNYMSCYIKGFDIGSIVTNAYKQSGKSTLCVDILSKTYEYGNSKCKISHLNFLYPSGNSSKCFYERSYK